MKSTRVGNAVLLAALLMAGFAGPVFAGPVRFVASDCCQGPGGAKIYLLDSSLNTVSSFAAGDDQPNGTASDGTFIYSGHPAFFGPYSVYRYDFSGNVLGAWWDVGLVGVHGMTMVGTELAVFDNLPPMVRFYNPISGAFSRSIFGPDITRTIEGLAYDGSVLWALGDRLFALDPLTGATLHSLPNVARDNGDLDWPALATNGAGELVIGARTGTTIGKWYRVSTTDGSVIASGNNGIEMNGLDEVPAGGSPVPEPASLLLFGTGLVGLRAWRQRRQ